MCVIIIVIIISLASSIIPSVQCSNATVMKAINEMPNIRARNCLTDSLGSCSCKRSGRTVTRAICKNPPAVKGIIHEVRASMADVTPEPPIATRAPKSPAPAVNSCARAASHRENPERSNMAKSPTSCGISCTREKKTYEKWSYIRVKSTYIEWQT